MKRTESKRRVVMTNDPSIRGWGYTILDWSGNILEAGCIRTKSEHKKRRIRKGDDTVRRIGVINDRLKEVMNKYDVVYILAELPHGSQSASGAMMIGIVTGMVATWGHAKDIGIEWYSQGDVKKCIFGRQSVTKKEMIEKIDELYDVPWKDVKYKDEAIADSMGVYHTARQKSSALKLMSD